MNGPENPPAFPSVCLSDPGHPASIPGMTLRDWFAGQVLPAAAQEPPKFDQSMEDASAALARLSYRVADAMLVQRARPCSALLPSETVSDAWIDRWWPDMATPEGRAEIRLQLDTLMADVRSQPGAA